MNEAVFKTAVMGGFSKSEVLAFIDKQDAQFKARERELLSRIATLDKQLKSESQHSQELAARIGELESQLETEKARCDEAIRKLEAAHAEVGKTKNGVMSEIERRNTEIDRLNSMVNMLNRKVSEAEQRASAAEAEAEESKRKLELIDKSEEQIGKAILEAQKTADKIINEAKTQADEILSKANSDADEMVESARVRVRRINSEAQEKLDAIMMAVEDYKNRVINSRNATAGYFDSIDSMFASMQNTAEEILNRYANVFNKEEPKQLETEAESAATDAVGYEDTVDDNSRYDYLAKSQIDFDDSAESEPEAEETAQDEAATTEVDYNIDEGDESDEQ